jgi:hypothetical protein
LFKVFSEPAGYMGAFCRTRVTQLADFAAPECQSAAGIIEKWKSNTLNFSVKYQRVREVPQIL